MKHGFQNHVLHVLTGDGRNCDLLEWLYYTDSYGRMIRTQTRTDGGSTPWWLWWLIPPFGKRYWLSFVLHDGCFRDCLEIWLDGDWKKWSPTEAESNWLIRDALRSQRANSFKRAAIYIALQWCGWRAFDEDRRRKSK